jgi:hypothetical protein
VTVLTLVRHEKSSAQHDLTRNVSSRLETNPSGEPKALSTSARLSNSREPNFKPVRQTHESVARIVLPLIIVDLCLNTPNYVVRICALFNVCVYVVFFKFFLTILLFLIDYFARSDRTIVFTTLY